MVARASVQKIGGWIGVLLVGALLACAAHSYTEDVGQYRRARTAPYKHGIPSAAKRTTGRGSSSKGAASHTVHGRLDELHGSHAGCSSSDCRSNASPRRSWTATILETECQHGRYKGPGRTAFVQWQGQPEWIPPGLARWIPPRLRFQRTGQYTSWRTI